MRIMSKAGRGSLARVQLGPTAPWDTGQAGRAQGALITRSVRPTGREGAGGKDGEQRAVMMMDEGAAVDRSKKQEQGLWLGPVRGSRCWQHEMLCQSKSLK